MNRGFHREGLRSFAPRLTITRDPLIQGAIFYTIGPKRAYRLWRLRNGVSILFDPVDDVPFGWMVMEGLMTESIIETPLTATLTVDPR